MHTHREPALTVPLRDGTTMQLRPDQMRGLIPVVDAEGDLVFLTFYAGGKTQSVLTTLTWSEGMRRLFGEGEES